MGENEETKSYKNPRWKLTIALDNLIADVLLGQWDCIGDDRERIFKMFEEVQHER